MNDIPAWVAIAAWFAGMGYMWTIMRIRQRKPVVAMRREPQYDWGWIVDYVVNENGEAQSHYPVAAYARRHGGTPIWRGFTDDRGVIIIPRNVRMPASGSLYVGVDGRDRIQWTPPRTIRA